MKAIAVENRNGRTAVLLEDGRMVIRKGTIPVGRSIEISEPSAVSLPRMALACICVLAMLVSFVTYRNYTWTALAYSTITVHNSASIEYTLNRSGDVIAVTAVDEASGETAAKLEETSLNKKGTEAVKEYIGTLAPDEEIDVHVSSKGFADEENLIHELDAAIDTSDHPNIHTGRKPREEYENMHDDTFSPADVRTDEPMRRIGPPDSGF